MKTYQGGEKVGHGTYLNTKSGEFVDLNAKMVGLPGTSLNNFIRVPRWLPFIAGPAVGLFFIIFLPLAGIIGLANGAAIKIGQQTILRRADNRRTAELK